MKILFFFIFCFLIQHFGFAQETKIDTLKAVEIYATRLQVVDNQAPFAVSVLDKYRLQTATQQLSPYESLSAIAGVFAMNPDNFSQDLRVSIRGFGARAAFGIRGIRVFVDGLPEGTPDGQVDVDNLDMGIISHLEVLRGTASGLYGNAAGGVIYMLTENPIAKKTLAEVQISAGSYNFRRYQAKFGQKLNKFSYFLNLSNNKTVGYRAWSAMENSILNAKMTYQFQEKTKLTILANTGNSPTANDAGALVLAQVSGNPQQAAANNLLYETGESVNQNRIGATFESQITEKSNIQAKVFLTNRHLINRLPILGNGFGDLKRKYGGVGLSYQLSQRILKMPYRLKIGFDLEQQQDNRQRFAYKKIVENNITKYLQDKQVLSQLEAFKSFGAYFLQDIEIKKWFVSLGVRFDDLNLKATDNYLTDGDQSGKNHFSKVNSLAGISYQLNKKANLYANYSTSFESPTLNELSNNPDGKGGFNPTLKPQEAQSYEIGSKGYFSKSLKYNVALFQIETKNDLIPYQIAGQTGKTFYRNAGKTQRKGLELELSWQVSSGLTLHYAQTFSDFKYKNYTVNNLIFDGKTMAGIPQKHNQLELRYFSKKGFFLIFQNKNVGKIYANDANTAFADAYNIFNLRVGQGINLKYGRLEPFVGINNISNQNYIANIQINAQAERYFEPASKRYYFGGVKFAIR